MMEEARSLNTFFRPITDKAEFPEVRARMILQTYRIIHPTKTAPSRATRTNAASSAVPVTFRAMNASPRTSKTNAATKGTLEKLRSAGSSRTVANVKDSQAPPTAPSRSTTNSTSALARLPIARSAYAIHQSAWKGVFSAPLCQAAPHEGACESATRLLKTASETRLLRHRSASLRDLPSAIFLR